ncbi:MAG: NAD(P)/FAD-dependent oxidoreductase [Pigmentiphaga sp.]
MESQAVRSRRDFLRRSGLLATAAASAGASIPVQAQASQAHIVIAGAGMAGLSIANRLRRRLEGARITLIDAKREHNYQPGYTLVATGVWPVEKVRDLNQDFISTGVEWIQEMIASFEPDANIVVTASGQRIRYDYLVVATGLELHYDAIEGMDVAAIGRHGLGSVYASPAAAAATWVAMDQFRARGGQALLTLPAGPLKCAGAPLKMTFMLRDRLYQSGTLHRSRVEFLSALGPDIVFGVPVVNDNVLARWRDLGIEASYQQTLRTVDIPRREARIAQADGSVQTRSYDFLHVVPPMRAPVPVRDSALAWQDGGLRGWLEVDPQTLRHRRYPNVFGLGDVNGTPRGKTAATVKKSAPVVEANLLALLAERDPATTFDGYTSCPLLVREGAAMLIEFDYEGRLTPTIPFLEPLKASYFGWLTKYALLKPAYLATLRGRV